MSTGNLFHALVIWCTSMTHGVLPVLCACTDYATSNRNNPLPG